MAEQHFGKILGIAVRSGRGGPMRELTEAQAATDRGIETDLESSPDRGITFLSARQWARVASDLGTDLPWHTRRANVLVDAGSLAPLIGRRVRLGQVEVDVIAETRPCAVMDQQHPGLKSALSTDCRGGVYGRVVTGGRFRVGDAVNILAPV